MSKIKAAKKSVSLAFPGLVFCPINPRLYKDVLKITALLVFVPFFVFSTRPPVLFADIIDDISSDQTFASSMSEDGTAQQIAAPDGAHFSSPDYDIPSNTSVSLICEGACSWNVTESSSEILGRWLTEGIWTFVNPFGIHIGAGAQVDVSGSLVLSTLSLVNELAAANQTVFEKSGPTPSTIFNEGFIRVRDGGSLALLSERVVNHGTIQATLGQVMMGTGEKMTLSFDPDGWISLVIDKGVSTLTKDTGGNSMPSLHNRGTVEANGGRIQLSAKMLNDTLDLVINNEGMIEAQEAAVTKDGAVTFVDGRAGLFSNGGIANSGVIRTNRLDERGYTFENRGALDGGTRSGEVYLDNIDGAANISGNIGANISDTGNINVTGNVTLTNQVTLMADSDNSGGGDFIQQAGTSINGANKNLTIRSGPSASSGTGHVQFGSIANVNQLNITAGGGNITQMFGSVSARNIAFAAGGNVALAGSITASKDDINVVADSDGNGAGAVSFAAGTSLEASGCNGDSIMLKGANPFTYGAVGPHTVSSNGGATNASLSGFTSVHIQSTGPANNVTIVQSLFSGGGCTGTYSFESDGDIVIANNLSFTSATRHMVLTAGGLISALGNFAQSNGAVTVNGVMDLDGSFSQFGGTFNAPAVLTIGNDFMKTGGTFHHRNGKVVFDSPAVADIDVNGAINFWDFESTQAGKTLRFGANDVFHVLSPTGWTITGAVGNLITLTRFGGAGLDQWFIDAAVTNVSGVSVSHSNNIGAPTINPLNSIDGGNNTAWFSPVPPPVFPPLPPVFPPDADPINAQLTPGQISGLEGVDIEPGAVSSAAGEREPESAIGERAGPQSMFVANLEGLQVFDANASESLKTFRWNEAPVSMRSSENGGNVYALLQKAKELLVIDSASLEVKRRIGGLAEESTDIALSPAEDIAYVPSAAIDAVQVVDLNAGRVTKAFPAGSFPSQIVISGDGKYLFVSNQLDKTISKIDVSAGREEAVFHAGESPFGMALAHHDQELFVTDTAANAVLVFGTGIVAVRPLEHAAPSIQTDVTSLEISYEANQQSASTLMSETVLPYQLTAKIQVGSFPYAIRADRAGKRLFVSNRGGNSISVIDTVTRQVIAEIAVGNRPAGIDIDPEGKRMFVANELSGSVSFVDLMSGNVIGHMPAGVVPNRVLFNTAQKPQS